MPNSNSVDPFWGPQRTFSPLFEAGPYAPLHNNDRVYPTLPPPAQPRWSSRSLTPALRRSNAGPSYYLSHPDGYAGSGLYPEASFEGPLLPARQHSAPHLRYPRAAPPPLAHRPRSPPSDLSDDSDFDWLPRKPSPEVFPALAHVTLPQEINVDTTISPTFHYHSGVRRYDLRFTYYWAALDCTHEEIPLGTGDEQAIGRHLRGKIIKLHVRSNYGDDIIAVAPRPVKGPLPAVRSLTIVGEPCEGQRLSLEYEYTDAGRLFISWFRGSCEVEKARDRSTYLLKSRDAFHSITAQITPMLDDGTLGHTVSARSLPIQPLPPPPPPTPHRVVDGADIIADVGNAPRSVDLDVAIRGDTMVGSTLRAHLVGPQAEEWNGRPHIRWTRVGPPNAPLLAGPDGEYTVTDRDVGCLIQVDMKPAKINGEEGPALSATTSTLCRAAESVRTSVLFQWRKPTHYSNVNVGETLVLQVSAKDQKALSSPPFVRWLKDDVVLKEGSDLSYHVEPGDVDHRIEAYCELAGWRDTLQAGAIKQRTHLTVDIPTSNALPPIVRSHRLVGQPKEFKELRAEVEVTYYGNPGPDTIAWYRGSTEVSRGEAADTSNMSYRCTGSDVGCLISYKYMPVNSNGVRGNMVSDCTAEVVQKAPPVHLENVFVGRKMRAPFMPEESHHHLVTWYKSRDGADWSKLYETDEKSVDPDRPEDLWLCFANADLLNYVVKCALSETGDDGALMYRMESMPAVVRLSSAFQEKLEEFLAAGRQAMDIRVNNMPAAFVLDHRGFKVLVNGKKYDEARWAANVAFVLDPAEGNKFQLRHSKDQRLPCSLGEASQRDMTAVLFRCFMAMGIKEIAERVVGREAALAWHKGKLVDSHSWIEFRPDYNIDKSPVLRTRPASTDQLNRPLVLDVRTPLSSAERTEQEIFICRFGLAYWQARAALEHVVTGSRSTPRPSPNLVFS